MPFFRTLTLTSALALAAGPALADITPSEVWDDWQSLLARYGADLTFDRTSNDGDAISIIGLSAAIPVADGASLWELGTLTFADNGDGTVTVEMDDELPFTLNVTGPDGEDGIVGFTVRQPDAKLIASGTPDNLRYDFDYPTVEMTDFIMEGPEVPDDVPVDFDFTLSALTGFVEFTGADARTYDSETALDLLSLVMNFRGETPEEGSGAFSLTMKDLTQTTRGSVGNIAPNMSLAQLIEAGTTQIGSGTHGEVTYDIIVDTSDGSFQMAAAALSGEISGAMDKNGISYGGTTNDVTVSIGGSTIPLPPLTFRMAQSGGAFSMPLVPGDDPQPFALSFTMVGLEIDDMLWGMIDPAGALPRDPITLLVDTGGNVIVSQDFTAPEFAESGTPGIPGSIEDLHVNALQLTIAGAELTGDGAFTFDNSTGIPTPAGVANLMLSGGNGLLDKLVGMGLVQEEQAMGARMMIGLFARPGGGEDTLQSTIELKEDGSVLANGQRIR